MRLVLLLVVAGCRTQPLETTPPRDLAPLVDLAPRSMPGAMAA